LAVVSDYDADGLSAAVLIESYLTERQRAHHLETPGKDRNIWDTHPDRWLEEDDEAALVLDLGSRGDKLFPIPTLFIDHHRYNPPADGDQLYTGYDRDPVPTTAGLVWELVGDEVPHKKWLAAVGTFGDLGTKAPFAYLQETKKEYTAKALSETVSLINAARRFSEPQVDVALEALRIHSSPKELAKSEHASVIRLHELRDTVQKETDKGKQAAPTFSDDTALVVVNSPCQIHPIIAQIWRTRLPKYYVLVANTNYEKGKVHFSGRSRGDKSILQKLRSLKCWYEGSGFGQGHDKAAGGVVGWEMWREILEELGFDDRGEPEEMKK